MFVPFDYGASKEGYWSYEHLIIQIEDCVDILYGIYGDKHEILLLFDHMIDREKMVVLVGKGV